MDGWLAAVQVPAPATRSPQHCDDGAIVREPGLTLHRDVVQICSARPPFARRLDRASAGLDRDSARDAAMNHDPLSDVLRSVRLRGAIFYYVSCRGEWVAETPAAPEIAEALMPGRRARAGLPHDHQGQRLGGDRRRAAGAPGGRRHRDVSARRRARALQRAGHARAAATTATGAFATRNDPKPIPVAYHRGVLRPGAVLPADEASTVVVCGFIGCDLRPFNPLIARAAAPAAPARRRRRRLGRADARTRPCRIAPAAGPAARRCSSA